LWVVADACGTIRGCNAAAIRRQAALTAPKITGGAAPVTCRKGRRRGVIATARHKQRHSTATDRAQHFTSFPHVPLHLIAYQPRMTIPNDLNIGKTRAAVRVRKASTIVISGI
jgi:hypothetical protein